MPELVQMAGGEDLFGAAGQPSPWLDWDEVVAADPDIILVHPCGFDMARTLQEMPLLEHRPGWYELKAVQRDRIVVAVAISISAAPGPASSKVWKSWPRSSTPSYSLRAMKGKVGCTTRLSRASRNEADMTAARKKTWSDEGQSAGGQQRRGDRVTKLVARIVGEE